MPEVQEKGAPITPSTAVAPSAPAVAVPATKKATGLTFRRFFTKPGVSPYDEIEWELRTANISDAQGNTIFEQKDVEVPKDWSMTATNIVDTTRKLRPGASEQGAAAQTAQNMSGVLAAGMSPDKIGERVVRAIQAGEFYIFTHPEWRGMAEDSFAEMLAAFSESADPSYTGDDIPSLVAANGARRMNVAVKA